MIARARWRAAVLGAAVAAGPFLAAGGEPPAINPGLLSCRVIVTGTDMRTRPAGLGRCIRDVVVRVTGRPGLAGDARVHALEARAAGLIEDFAYLDRMTDIPKHDEQGTRDRPYDLIAHADPAKLATELAALGVEPWTARPTLLALVLISKGDERFMLAADGDLGERQRQAILAAGETYGLRVSLPTADQLGASGDVPGKAAVVLNGSLTWSDADFGWNADWRLTRDGTRPWSVRGVSFDKAFRAGIGGAAEALSAAR